ncbi:unnamed protein product [Schistosoma curassoni]|uniref:Ovule protein n=1 Tax=Schistosoma curassoni TaxID=6186 RepID=A0A183JIF9_9TREM|nr:unnamed protein product [Schistosoma curassoni]
MFHFNNNLIIEYHCILSRISPSKNARESVDRPPVYSSIMHCLCKKCFNYWYEVVHKNKR